MFKTVAKIDGLTKGVGVRFSRPNADTTVCELRIGGETVAPKDMETEFLGIARRYGPDQFDKVRGHLASLRNALNKAGISRQSRKEIYAAYSDWAQANHIRTKIAVNTVGLFNKEV